MITRSLFVAIFFLILVPGQGSAETKPIRVAYAAIAGSQVPIWVLKESRRFEPMDLVYVEGASTVTAGLISGEIQSRSSGRRRSFALTAGEPRTWH